jgi:hypothetical protein
MERLDRDPEWGVSEIVNLRDDRAADSPTFSASRFGAARHVAVIGFGGLRFVPRRLLFRPS